MNEQINNKCSKHAATLHFKQILDNTPVNTQIKTSTEHKLN